MLKYLLRVGGILIAVFLFTFSSKATENVGGGKLLSIEGTYIFVSRDLTNGSAAKPLDVKGIMTYTKKYREFNISWKTPEGKHFSIAYMAEYTLTADSYQETPIYWMLHDETQGAPDYAIPADKAKASAIKSKDGKISFALNGENVTVTFDGQNMTAVSPEGFIDHWIKVE